MDADQAGWAREALVRDEPRGPILPASLGRFLDRCWSRKSACFQRSSALLCLLRVYPADRSPTAQFGQDRDFAVTLAGADPGLTTLSPASYNLAPPAVTIH